MHRRVRMLAMGLVLAWIVALVGLCLGLAANAVTQSLAPAPLSLKIRKAFTSGVLPQHTTQELDRERGALLYNDCLILGMALNRDPSLLVRIVSPALIESPQDEEINKDPCAILHDVTVNGNAALYRGKPYHRYVAAFVPFAAALVTEWGVASAKRTFLILNRAALIGLIAVGFFTCVLAYRNGAALPFYKVAFPAFILAFSGIEYFGQNLSIGIADLGLYGLIALLFYAQPAQWPRSALAIIAAAFGVFIGGFEFFTGQIPVMMALPVALLAMNAHDERTLRLAVMTGSLFTLFAALGTLFIFTQKIILALLVDGPSVVSGFLNQLAVRVGDGSYTIGTMLMYMAGRADRIGQGSLTLGLAYAFSATLLGLAALAWLGRRGGFPFRRAVAIAGSMALIVIWHVIFRNHSTIHSEFMVRSTSFVFASGFIIAAFAIVTWVSDRTASSSFKNVAAMGGPCSPR